MNLRPIKKLNEDIQLQKAEEAKAGLFLAKKVDALREELADAQSAHDLAMQSMKQEYDTLVGEYTSKKSSIETEIAYLEVKRAELLVPLDAEWSKLNELIANTTQEAQIYHDKQAELIEREKAVANLERQAEKTKVYTENTLSETKKAKEKALDLADLKQRELEEIEGIRADFQNEYSMIMGTEKEKERKLQYEIKHYQDFTERLKAKERELNLRETRLSMKENAKRTY